MYMKRGGPTPFFTKIPRNLDLWTEIKCMKRKGNNFGSCPFLPMTCQNTDLGMGKCEKHLSEKCEKQIFVLTCSWSIIIKSHWRMLCPNTQAVINGYAAGWGPRPFYLKRAEILIWGWENVYMKKGDNPIFYRSPGIWICGWEIFCC